MTRIPILSLAALCTLVCVIAPSDASAQSRDRDSRSPVSLHAGLGFTADPGTFLLLLEAPIEIGPHVSMGPLLQIGVEDNRTIVSPSWNLRFSLPLSELFDSRDETLGRITTYAQAGLGATHIDRDRGGLDIDDTGFLVNIGFGAEYRFNSSYSATTGMLLNFMPDDVLGEGFYFSWQMIGFRTYF